MSKKREYRVMLSATFTKEVRVMATSAKEVRQKLVYALIDDGDELSGVFMSEKVGQESVVDVVRVGEEWHIDRKGSTK